MNCINPYGFATLALGTLLSLSSLALHAQNTVPQSAGSDLTRQQLAAFDQFLDSHPDLAGQIRKDPSLVNREEYVQNHPELQTYLQDHPGLREELTDNPNAVMHQEQRFDRREERDQDRNRQDRDPDVTRRELANMDRFMDSHPEVAEQLRKDPSLVDDKRFVGSHPALQEFLAQHPFVREEYKENPNGFMNDERRFENREDSYRGSERVGDPDVTRRELANMDLFMDSHPEVAEQLRKDPSLVDDKRFVGNHPALQEFLAQHPFVREEYKENPNGFMNDERRFENREDSYRGSQRVGDPDVTRRELANMDRFMDSHPEVAEQLRKDPSLVDDKRFVGNHPALQEFLAQHPFVREEYKENPNGFMRQEQSFDRQQDSFMRRDRDVTRDERASFNEFMEDHNKIASEVSKHPSLATNEEYLENHPDLQQYLASHPKVQEGLRENPESFMKSAQQFETAPKATPKSATTEPKMK